MHHHRWAKLAGVKGGDKYLRSSALVGGVGQRRSCRAVSLLGWYRHSVGVSRDVVQAAGSCLGSDVCGLYDLHLLFIHSYNAIIIAHYYK